MDPLSISGVWLHTPQIHADARGSFFEAFRMADLNAATGHRMELAQMNCSVSTKGVLRGIHFADVPPGQAKYVTCVSGAILDVVVDLRVGSPTFLRWESVRLDDESRRGLFIAEGLGHGFLVLSEQATVTYLCSTPYTPSREHGVHAFDPSIGVDWRMEDAPILSERDAAQPSVKELLEAGALPVHSQCQAFYASLR
ncbi:dTDP-4-dehydrorhamnose 3,5-epimerase [Microbispora sp. NPDC088329]|uniref:dTDP-4-dehydrorhamnose 3,5-epimerase n=1 Tax=Microbispora sp. NPDC088329 TaxID=3154869 RepID=UPI003429AD50